MVSPSDDAAPRALAELIAAPEAERWARDCGWLPGTGHCRNRRCSRKCLFRAYYKAEAARIAEVRRRRRRAGTRARMPRAVNSAASDT